jgi:hypothetical protein
MCSFCPLSGREAPGEGCRLESKKCEVLQKLILQWMKRIYSMTKKTEYRDSMMKAKGRGGSARGIVSLSESFVDGLVLS